MRTPFWPLGVLAASLLVAAQILPGCIYHASATTLGANKFDLMLDYVAPSPPSGASPDAYRRVRSAMGRKAISDARYAGLRFLRVAVSGFHPADLASKQNDLALWQQDPSRFWETVDRMFDDLDAMGMQLVPSLVWNIRQFPALANDSIATFIRDPNSASRRLMARFVGDFIARYKGRKTILFYEMGNELNLLADLDLEKKCQTRPCIWSNITTADMNRFAREMVQLVKSLDPSRPISSGYSLPRSAAFHLEHRPQFSPTGPDWTPDTRDEFASRLIAMNQPFDIISIHVYPADETRPSGRAPRASFDPIRQAAVAARAAGKPLFIGEFGDPAGATLFMKHVMDSIAREGIDFASIWVWEFYQTSTYQTRNTPATRLNVEPGYTDDIIQLLMNAARRRGADTAPTRATKAPRVVLTWPLPCADVAGPTELAAVASDGARPIKEIEFLIDGKLVARGSTPPYTALFNPAGMGSRTAEIEARATGSSGAIASFRSTVHLNGDRSGCRPGA